MFGLLACGLGCSAETAKPRRAAGKREKRVVPPGPPPPANPPGTTIALAALEERARAMRARLDGRGFTVLVEAPFVVAGDEAADRVEGRAATTIRWSAPSKRCIRTKAMRSGSATWPRPRNSTAAATCCC